MYSNAEGQLCFSESQLYSGAEDNLCSHFEVLLNYCSA